MFVDKVFVVILTPLFTLGCIAKIFKNKLK